MTTAAPEQVKTFIDYGRIKALTQRSAPTAAEVDAVLEKALKLKGLNTDEAAVLLSIKDPLQISRLLETAGKVKHEIYGRRMVLFAPLYTGNKCTNNCLYCGFRKANTAIPRVTLSQQEIADEVLELLKEGHKRILMLCGESGNTPIEYTLEALNTAYSVEYKGQHIRRINVEIAPMSVEDFRLLKTAKIGTYTCFQETYDPELYRDYHPTGPKADYTNRLYVMDRAMEAGIDDVGVGVLFGLADYRFEVLALMEHARHLEEEFGCGPHTVSVPRIEPAPGAPLTENIPFPVSDDDFRKIVAIIRISMPYTGIILSTREKESLRTELFHYGVSQASAGSRTNPGGYKKSSRGEESSQFSLGDHRSLEEVIASMIKDKYIPSFCTGCYRKGRVGNDFMDLAKPGLIKHFCMPNGIFSFAEYLNDFANEDTRKAGFKLIEEIIQEDTPTPDLKIRIRENLVKVDNGERDLYL